MKTFSVIAFLAWMFASPSFGVSGPVSLAGTWRFELDREDAGIAERWFARPLKERLQLPGALQNQGFGDDITVETKWTGEVGTDRWKTGRQYEKYRQPGNIKVPFFLQPEKHYVGPAWYQRDIVIPEEWKDQRVTLNLERPHWETRVWLDGTLLGANNSLGAPHVYELGAGLKPGRHILAIRVDNRVLVEVGDWSHSVSDHTQGNWNGIVGRIELAATPLVWIEDLQAHPQAAVKSITVRGKLGNASRESGSGRLSLEVVPKFLSVTQPIASRSLKVHWSETGGEFSATLELGNEVQMWDEFNGRNTCELRAKLNEGAVKQTTFGLRSISAANHQFHINGRPAFFRGTLECCIFPLTGYPPMEVDYWRKIIHACKAHGLNHIRFHSWCPPEAAFAAADELGFYYQVECGVWTYPGNGKAIDQWIYDESERIVRAYGNHPSFVLFTHGNEPHGPKHEEYLARWVNHWKAKDSRFLVTSGAAYPQLPENQYHVYHGPRGPKGWHGRDYTEAIKHLDAPVIVHEMGQWCVYPNFDEVKKYTGPLKPKNFDIFRDSLADHGMIQQWKDFLRASGKLQVLCYKEEIEAAWRTPGIGGIQLLDLHDFPGQGTALIGVLDPFWESKGYVTPEEFRQFFSPTVPLARLMKRAFTTAETLSAEIEVAHFGPKPLERFRAEWNLLNLQGQAAASGQFSANPTTLPVGQRTILGKIRCDLSKLDAPAAYTLAVQITEPAGLRPASAIKNEWNIWVYPTDHSEGHNQGVHFTETLDEAALGLLEKGGKVLLATSKLSPLHPKLTFEPVFWNRYMFHTQGRQTLGMLCDPKHPALAQFPTDFFQDWQWNDIVTRARAVILDELPGDLRPIVQPIDDWNTNRKLGLVFECRAGLGKLLVCSADLSQDLDQRPAAHQLRQSLLTYAASQDFNPQVAVNAEALVKVLHWAARSTLVNLGAKVARVDSEDKANGNTAERAIDGDPDTIWHTEWGKANPAFPHELVIDLQREVDVRGFRLLPRQEQANGWFTRYAFYVSRDGQQWTTPAVQGDLAAEAAEKTVEFSPAQQGRFIRLVALKGHRNNPWAAMAEIDIIPVGK